MPYNTLIHRKIMKHDPKGFLNFNTPEDYLDYQDLLIYNWKIYHQYKHLSGGTMLSETYRQTGRTWSAVSAAVQLAERLENNKVVFVTNTRFPFHYFDDHPLLIKYKNHNRFGFNSESTSNHIGNITIISYNNLSSISGTINYYIYDHLVFEMCEPTYVPIGCSQMSETIMTNPNTFMKNHTLKLLMEDLEKVEQEATKILNQISNVLKLKND